MYSTKGRRSLIGAIALAVAVAVLPATSQAGADERAGRAARYIAQRQNPDGSFPSSFGSNLAATADAVMALVAARRAPSAVAEAIEWLEGEDLTDSSLGQKAKTVMAAVAAGEDLQDEPWASLVADMQASYEPTDGRYQSVAWSQVFDQALVILALKAAGESVPRAAAAWLADAQCPDGGWQFDQPRTAGEDRKCFDEERGGGDPALADYTASDTNTTAYSVMALAAARRSVGVGSDPIDWLRARRDPAKGGWGYDRRSSLTETVSTALVIQAYVAVGEKLPSGASDALSELQRGICGASADGFSRGWENSKNGYRKIPGADMGATVAAVPALLRKPLPVEPVSYLRPLPPPPPCPAP
jgi:hypothetical protein